MRNDPFAKLSGLDQKLFVPSSLTPARGQEEAKAEKRQRVEVRKERSHERQELPRFEPMSQGRGEGTLQRSFEYPKQRATERNSYDFYKDQILWLNRTKVEIQEKYGRRVTANTIVQLALDLLIQDYRRRGERSSLITNLVLKQPATERPDQGSSEPPIVPTSERTFGES